MFAIFSTIVGETKNLNKRKRKKSEEAEEKQEESI
jgi:hypothetical protein